MHIVVQNYDSTHCYCNKKKEKMKKQKLLCLFTAFYKCKNSTAKVQFLHKHKTMLQNYKINFVNVLALYAGIFVKTFFSFLTIGRIKI